MRRILLSAFAALALTADWPSPAAADAVADFYKGKVVTIVIGYAAGGFDLYARLLGRFLGGHIPGHPTIIAQNKPGAGSRAAANWLYNVAPRDGTVLATLSQTTPTDQALGQADIQFDARKFGWIGNMVVVNNILFVNASTGVTSLADAARKPLAIGGIPDLAYASELIRMGAAPFLFTGIDTDLLLAAARDSSSQALASLNS